MLPPLGVCCCRSVGSSIICKLPPKPLTPLEVIDAAVRDLGCEHWMFGKGWSGTLQGHMLGAYKYAAAVVNAEGKHEAMVQLKIGRRLIKQQAVTKQRMFAAMAEYDWETVLKCIDDGINPNDEAPNVRVVVVVQVGAVVCQSFTPVRWVRWMSW